MSHNRDDFSKAQKPVMDQSQLMNLIPVLLAVVLGIGGFLMMFTTIFTTRR